MENLIQSFRGKARFAVCTMVLAIAGLGLLTQPASASNGASGRSALFTISEEPVSPAVDYNILLFENLRLSLTGIVGVTYDDNINRSNTNEEDGFYTTPRLRLGIDWPLTPNIHFGTSASFGYRYYFTDPGEDRFVVGFADDLATYVKADIRVGEGTVRLSDHFSRSTDDLDIGRTTARDYVLNRNTVAARYSIPLNPNWSANFHGSRRDTWTSTDEFEYHDNVRHQASMNTYWQINPQFRMGPYFTYTDVDYTSDTGAGSTPNNDNETIGGGLNFLYRFQAGASIEGHLGYEDSDNDTNLWATDQARGLVGRIAANFESSRNTGHTLSITHNRNQDIISPFVNYSEETTYKYAITSNVFRDFTLRGDIALIDIEESDFGEDAELWRAGLGASYALGPKTSARVRYEYWDKSSDFNSREYDRNRVSLYLEYDF